MSSLQPKRILVLAANPKNSSQLHLGKEVREIDEGLRRSRHPDQFELVSKWAVRSRDFYRHILDVQPHIIHFSGHGAGEDGIVLEDEDGTVRLVSTNALESLFKLFASKGLECVLLNACFSEVQAKAISQYIPYVIGMNREIGDQAAIVFAVAFYDALGAGETVEFAFNLACVAIQMSNIPENLTPVLKRNSSLDRPPAVSQSNAAKGSGSLTVNQRRRLERERNELQEIHDIYSNKVSLLRNARVVETDVAVKMKLDVQIRETEAELNKLELRLDVIEQQIG